MKNKGWVSVYRELTEKPIWLNSSPEQKTILITILLMVNHEEKEWEWKGQKYTVQPGQMITSLNSIVEKCGKGITTQNVRTALKRFEKLEFLTNKSTKQCRLITIVNWGKYQGAESKPNKRPNNQLTNNQQRPNNQLTTNNNDNNVNNDNNDDDKTEYISEINGLIKNKISSSSLENFINRFGVDKLDPLINEIKESDYLKENINFNHLSDDFINKAISGKYRTFKNEVNNGQGNKLPKDFSQFNLGTIVR